MIPTLQSYAGLLLETDNPLNHVVDWPIFTSGEWWLLTNHMVMMFLAAGLMLVVFIPMTRRYQSGELVPTGTRNMFEAVLVYLREDVVRPVMGPYTDRFIPYLWTLFFFILFMNLLGLLPLEPITGFVLNYMLGLDMHPIYGTPTANPYVVVVLALLSFILIQVNGIRANGFVGYLKHFLGGAPWYVAPILVPVEFLGMFIKPFALFIRLLANMTAGHVLIAVILGFTVMAYDGMGKWGALAIGIPAIIASVAAMCLELFVAFLQAYIFTLLTALFIGQLIVHEGEDHGHEHGEAHPPRAQAAPTAAH